MPDISNEDLMKLICRISKKVDIIEEKLDKLLEDKIEKIQTEKVHGKVDPGFCFAPIANDKDLNYVTKRITEEEQYKKNLRNFIQNHEDFHLTDIFTPDFLCQYNYHGVSGQKKLEGLVPFEQIYVFLKSINGETFDDIKTSVMKEIRRVKRRISSRNLKVKPNQQVVLIDNGKKPEEQVDEMENDNSYQCKTENIEEDLDLDEGTEDLDEDMMETEVSAVSGQVFIQEEKYDNIQDGEDVDDDESYEDGVDFHPMKNNLELKRVSKKIKESPEYLKQLRIQIVEESEDGQCTLTQLFTEEFLENFNTYGMCKKKKLIDLVPYQEVYFYLKNHLGLSLKQIEADASRELKRIKRRLNNRRVKEGKI